MRVTAYCPCRRCCGRWARVPLRRRTTASGASLKELIDSGRRFCAADSRIPFGTRIDIPGYGVARVEDRGGAITAGRLDVFFPTHARARAWGVRWLDVKIREAAEEDQP